MNCTHFAVAVLACALPSVALAAPAGTLISAIPIAGAPAGAQAWQMRYWTSSDRNLPIEVSGVVVAPLEAAPPAPRKVLAWAHGTWGVAAKCAVQPTNVLQMTAGLPDAIRRGYVVVAPDYPGFGSPMPHPYLVGVSAGRAMLDGVRAARSIPGADAGNRFAVWGESQGGHAALWTGQLQRSYAPDLRLVGVAAAAPPTDLVQNLTAGSDPSIRAFLTAFTADSWARHYNAPLSALGGRQTQRLITRLAQNNCISLTAKPRLGTVLGIVALRRNMRNVNIGQIAPWAGIARQNSVAATPYGVPFLIAQNPRDVIVGPDVTRGFVHRLCRAGGRVRFIAIIGKGHETSARDSATSTLAWVDDRFAGRPAPSDCGRV